MAVAATTLNLFTPPPSISSFSAPKFSIASLSSRSRFNSVSSTSRSDFRSPHRTRRTFVPKAVDDDAPESSEEFLVEDEIEEVDEDYDLEYEPLPAAGGSGSGEKDDTAMIHGNNFMSTPGWNSEKIVDYRINEEDFHKISLLECDFFIRRPPDPDRDVYDFREMYVTPPDTDVYAIPRVLAPLPEKYIRCAKTNYGRYNVTEPPVDALRDPLYKSEREVFKVFLTKHYKNRRLGDPEFMLDFEEIYVLDSKTKSITRGKVVVTVREGRNRDRKFDLLVIRDNGNSFKIIDSTQRDNPTTVIEKEEWAQGRQDMEKHLSKLRDFEVSNWI
ncbi:PLASTID TRANSCRIPTIONALLY ACTIVE protein 6, chloroplastic [Linum perenne]